MNVTEAVTSRRSVRGFLPTPVPPELIRRAVELAARAPSGGNVQPWHISVIGGAALDELKTIMQVRVFESTQPEIPEYDVYPKKLGPPYRDYRFQLAEEMYGHIGVPREDKVGRLKWFARNYQFFGAPLAVFCSVDRQMGPPQWSDLGMYLQTLMLLLREQGVDSCPQECWAVYPATVGSFLKLPAERMLFCGMAIGYADADVQANRLHSQRAPLEAYAEFRGI